MLRRERVLQVAHLKRYIKYRLPQMYANGVDLRLKNFRHVESH